MTHRFALLLLSLLSVTNSFAADSAAVPPITAAAFGDLYDMSDGAKPIQQGGDSNQIVSGDTWLSTWAADGRAYLIHDDGQGFDNLDAPMARNRLCRLDGNPNDSTSGFRGVNLNPGLLADSLPNHEATMEWRIGYSSSIHEQDGILYLIRHNWSPESRLWPPIESSIIKSSDGGKTWLNHLGQANAPLPDKDHSMFARMPWAFMTFVQFGKGGATPEIDNAGQYVYLTATTHLARVPRRKLADLNAADFQYYRGESRDGTRDSSWSNDPSDAKPSLFQAISDSTGQLVAVDGAVKNVLYNQGLQCYVGAGSAMYFAPGESGHDKGKSRFVIYVAKHPWGPWRQLVSHGMWGRAGWDYLLCNKYTVNDGKKMWFTFCGEYKGDIYNYGLQYTPLYLSTGPVDKYEAESATLARTHVASEYPSFSGTGYATGFANAGDKITFKLTNVNDSGWHIVRIRYTSPKVNGNTMSVYVNGKKARRIKLSLNNSDFKPAQDWVDHSAVYHLRRGDNTFEIQQDEHDSGDGVLIDYIAVSRDATYNEGVNLSPEAAASASSGEPARATKGWVDGAGNEWLARGAVGEWIKLDWSSPQAVGKVVLYDLAAMRDQVVGGTLSFSDGSSLPVGSLQNDGQAGTVIAFPPREITWVKFTIDAVRPGTKSAGLAEMQVYTFTGHERLNQATK